jgi:hypothetical protein
VTLTTPVPIPLARFYCPVETESGIGTTLRVAETVGGARDMTLDKDHPKIHATGRFAAGGYVAELPTQVGSIAFMAPQGSDFCYEATLRPDQGQFQDCWPSYETPEGRAYAGP